MSRYAHPRERIEHVPRPERVSECDRCGQVVRDRECAFSPGARFAPHGGCGGTFRPAWMYATEPAE